MAARANLRLRLWGCFGRAAASRRGPDSQHCCASIKIRTLHCRKAAVSLQRLMLRVLRKAAFQEIMFSKTSSLGKV
jgi:hypothetical protein